MADPKDREDAGRPEDVCRDQPGTSRGRVGASRGRGGGSGKRRRGRGRFAVSCVRTAFGLATVLVLLIGVIAVRLKQGPIVVPGVSEKIEAALREKFGNGLRFAIGETTIVERGLVPTLSIDRLAVSGSDGQKILSAPRAEISVDAVALMVGRVVPKRLEVFDVTLQLALLKNGNLAVAASGGKPFFQFGSGSEPVPKTKIDKPPVPVESPNDLVVAPPRRDEAMKAAAEGLRRFIDLLTNPKSAIAAVDRLGITRGTLVIAEEETGDETVYKDFDLAFDKAKGISTFEVSAQGPSRRWSISARASGTPGAERRFAATVANLSMDELQFASGTKFSGIESDMPIAAGFDLGLKPDDTLREAAGRFKIGPGFMRIDDPDQEPQFIDAVDGAFHWNPAKRQIDVDTLNYEESGTRLSFAGHVTSPLNDVDPWRVEMATTEEGVVAPERKGQEPIAITNALLSGRLLLAQKTFVIDRFVFQSTKGGLALAGQVDWIDGPHVRFGAKIDPTPVKVAERLWPAFAASPVRAWILSHFEDGMLTSGSMQIDFDKNALTRMRADRAPLDSAVSLDFTISNGRLRFLDGVPPLEHGEGVGHITGRTSHFTINTATMDAKGQTINVSDVAFVVPNANVHPVMASLSAHLSGSVEAVNYVLTREAIKPYASIPLDPATLHGRADGRLEQIMVLGPHKEEANPLKVDAKLTNFSADRLIGKEGLDNATVGIVVDDGTLKATGQGRIFGTQANFEITRVGGGVPNALINLTLDDAARTRVGLPAIPGVAGPIGAKVSASLGDPAKIKAQVDLDLTKTSIAAAILGLSKPAGKPARIAFAVTPGDTKTVVDPLVIDVGSLQAKGIVDLAGDMDFQSARFSSFRVSPGDDMKLEVGKADDTFKLTIRGSTIDARPFLKALTSTPANESTAMAKSAKAEKAEADSFKGFDIDLKSGILTGFNKEVLTGVDLNLSRRGPLIRQFAVQGHFGRNVVQGSMAADQTVKIYASDSGALLSFIDLYKHMEGGQLNASMKLGADTLAGYLEIKDFTLRDEPAIRRLVAQSTEVSAPGQDADAARRIDAGAVRFRRLKVNFSRAGSRLELRDATMYGPEIGLSVDGWLDYSHDRVAMNGTFVPAFAINNLFSQIPVLGVFLGGKSNEGLLAITFKISGLASSPTLSINPLSFITPGFVRNIFGLLDQPGDGTASPAPSPPPTR